MHNVHTIHTLLFMKKLFMNNADTYVFSEAIRRDSHNLFTFHTNALWNKNTRKF